MWWRKWIYLSQTGVRLVRLPVPLLYVRCWEVGGGRGEGKITSDRQCVVDSVDSIVPCSVPLLLLLCCE